MSLERLKHSQGWNEWLGHRIKARVEVLRQQLQHGYRRQGHCWAGTVISCWCVCCYRWGVGGGLVTQHINTGDAKPVKTLPHWLPHAVWKELEEELDKLMQTGCVKPSSSPYTSPLVFVRKKEGGRRTSCLCWLQQHQSEHGVELLSDSENRRVGSRHSRM